MFEQLKILKKELGLEKDEKVTLLSKFRERLEKRNVEEEILSVITGTVSVPLA